uniref:Peptidase A1 domain-containing protein n=1 Tax=Bursaphelenchus xylophilus TaxID=6326 RepID=A0A1I7SRB5_BURXY
MRTLVILQVLFLLCVQDAWASHVRIALKEEEEDDHGLETNAVEEDLKAICDTRYIGKVAIGEPPQYFNVMFDTGTSAFWVPEKNCVRLRRKKCPTPQYDASLSKTKETLQKYFSLRYDSAYVNGTLYKDKFAFVTRGGTLIRLKGKVEFGAGNVFKGTPVGMIGLAPEQGPHSSGSNVMQQAIQEGVFGKPIFTTHLRKSIDHNRGSGVITLGNVDTEHCEKDVHYVKAIKGSKWGVHMESAQFTYGGKTLNFGAHDVHTDTGSAEIRAPKQIYQQVAKALGIETHKTTRKIFLPCNTAFNFSFHIDKRNYFVSWTELLKSKQKRNDCWIALKPTNDKHWTFGHPFAREYCLVHDFKQRRIGFSGVKTAHEGSKKTVTKGAEKERKQRGFTKNESKHGVTKKAEEKIKIGSTRKGIDRRVTSKGYGERKNGDAKKDGHEEYEYGEGYEYEYEEGSGMDDKGRNKDGRHGEGRFDRGKNRKNGRKNDEYEYANDYDYGDGDRKDNKKKGGRRNGQGLREKDKKEKKNDYGYGEGYEYEEGSGSYGKGGYKRNGKKGGSYGKGGSGLGKRRKGGDGKGDGYGYGEGYEYEQGSGSYGKGSYKRNGKKGGSYGKGGSGLGKNRKGGDGRGDGFGEGYKYEEGSGSRGEGRSKYGGRGQDNNGAGSFRRVTWKFNGSDDNGNRQFTFKYRNDGHFRHHRFFKLSQTVEKLDGENDVSYYAHLLMGTPAQNVTVNFDTGSSTLWTPAPKAEFKNGTIYSLPTYLPLDSSTATCLEENFTKSYGTATVSGKLYRDKISFSGGGEALSLADPVVFGCAYRLDGPFKTGIIGMAPPPSKQIGSNIGQELIKVLDKPIFTTFLKKSSGSNQGYGYITLGGLDKDNCANDAIYAKVVQKGKWAVALDSTRLDVKGKKPTVFKASVAVTDSGCSTIKAPHDAYKKIAKMLNFKLTESRVYLPCDTAFTLTFSINGKEHQVPSSQILIKSLKKPSCALALQKHKNEKWILGQPFMRQFCLIHNVKDLNLGFSTAK